MAPCAIACDSRSSTERNRNTAGDRNPAAVVSSPSLWSDWMKRRVDALQCQMELVGVLARYIPTRLIEISRSGCLLESGHRVEEGTVGALRLEVRGQIYAEDVRATRCVAVAGSGSSYLIGVEFLQTG